MHWLRRAQPVLVALLVAALAGWAAGVGTAEGKKLAGPQIVRGEIGPGALYELSMPDAWNGDLVLWVRGLPMEPITLPDISPLRDGLLALGYGVAYSSLSEVGVAIQDGVIRTRQLRGVFASRFGQPRRTYLISSSLGGAMALRLAEENANHYDGVMPTCGIVGGMPMVIDYFFTVRVLFDYFYPGVVPETPVSEVDFWTIVAPTVAGAIFTDPGPAMELAGVDQVEITYLDMNELLESILLPVFFTNWDFWVGDVRARAHGRDPFDNASVLYTGSSDDPALNAGVRRHSSSPDARNYFEHWYLPTGQIQMPVLTLHNVRDPVVPQRHLDAFRARVAAAGRSDWLAERTVNRFGHCTWDPAEELAAFQALAAWVETGVKP